ncbi:MAG: NADH-quinone oxidoreductase subunit C/D [Armatimonadota bacterium]
MGDTPEIIAMLQGRFPQADITVQPTADGVPTAWVPADGVKAALRFLKTEVERPFRMLYDLTAIDERMRGYREGQPASDFTVVYHLFSFDRKSEMRLKVPLRGETPSLDTITDLWPSANWYEREVWDMFGVGIDGHPHLTRILLPPWWEGHALRKEHPARRTEMGRFQMPGERQPELMETLKFDPAEWGMRCDLEGFECMYLNFGPHHPSTHGVFRIILQLCGQEIVDAVCDIGYHHRAQEKLGERQSWHTYLPYTDRVDYLSGVLNNFPYVLSVEKLAGIEVPDRARVIRIMMAELFRIISHLVYLGTFVQDLGMMSPVFYFFTDRERAFTIVEAVTGARMHPSWFRIGGTAHDLPEGWETLVRDFIDYMRKRLVEYPATILDNFIFRARSVDVSPLAVEEAIEWGVTGPMLRACGLAWDMRKAQPYGGYEEFEFDIPTGEQGDCFDRAAVHMAEIEQSLRIMEQCLHHMPAGPHKAKHPLAVPPLKTEHTMYDIETLINHFLGVSWGPVIPAGEASVITESSKGQYSYYLISDGSTSSYRTRIRASTYPHLQILPKLTCGLTVPDLVAILGSLDFVMGDVDR